MTSLKQIRKECSNCNNVAIINTTGQPKGYVCDLNCAGVDGNDTCFEWIEREPDKDTETCSDCNKEVPIDDIWTKKNCDLMLCDDCKDIRESE